MTENALVLRMLTSLVLLEEKRAPELHTALVTFRDKVVVFAVNSDHVTLHFVTSVTGINERQPYYIVIYSR